MLTKAVQRVRPVHIASQRARVGIEQQLVMIEPMAVLRRVRSVRAIAIQHAGGRVRQIAVPDFVGVFRQRVARDLMASGWLEQAQIDPLCVRREHREVDAEPVPRRAERIRPARQQRVGQMLHASGRSGARMQEQRRQRRQCQFQRLRLAMALHRHGLHRRRRCPCRTHHRTSASVFSSSCQRPGRGTPMR